jgi:hypothetical protein
VVMGAEGAVAMVEPEAVAVEDMRTIRVPSRGL